MIEGIKVNSLDNIENDLLVLLSRLKKPVWYEQQKDSNFKSILREFLQKCSGDHIVAMLKVCMEKFAFFD